MVTHRTERILAYVGFITLIGVVVGYFVVDAERVLSEPGILFKPVSSIITYLIWIWSMGISRRRIKNEILLLCEENKAGLGSLVWDKKTLNKIVDACNTFRGKRKSTALQQLKDIRSSTDNSSERTVVTYILFVLYHNICDKEAAARELELLKNLSPYFLESVHPKYGFQ